MAFSIPSAPHQRFCRAVGTLEKLGEIVGRVGIDRPILIGVGRVFADVEPAALLGFEPERLDASRQTSRLQAKAV